MLGLIAEADSVHRTATMIPTRFVRRVVSPRLVAAETTGRGLSPADISLKVWRPGPLRVILERTWPALHRVLTNGLGMLPDPPERAVIEDYLRGLIGKIRVDIEAKTFIPSEVRKVPETPPRFVSGAGFTLPIQQLIMEIAGLSGGGDAASAQISALSKRSRRVRHVLRTLMRSEEPLVLLGEPGAGKSLTLQMAALELAERNKTRVLPIVPLFLSVGNGSRSKNLMPKTS